MALLSTFGHNRDLLVHRAENDESSRTEVARGPHLVRVRIREKDWQPYAEIKRLRIEAAWHMNVGDLGGQ